MNTTLLQHRIITKNPNTSHTILHYIRTVDDRSKIKFDVRRTNAQRGIEGFMMSKNSYLGESELVILT